MTDPDPMIAAVARCRAEEEAFMRRAAVEDYYYVPMEARAALAATVATTPAGLAELTGFILEMTREIGDAYFEGAEAVMFAESLDASVRGIFGADQDVT